jgi:hypothetical protein
LFNLIQKSEPYKPYPERGLGLFASKNRKRKTMLWRCCGVAVPGPRSPADGLVIVDRLGGLVIVCHTLRLPIAAMLNLWLNLNPLTLFQILSGKPIQQRPYGPPLFFSLRPQWFVEVWFDRESESLTLRHFWG